MYSANFALDNIYRIYLNMEIKRHTGTAGCLVQALRVYDVIVGTVEELNHKEYTVRSVLLLSGFVVFFTNLFTCLDIILTLLICPERCLHMKAPISLPWPTMCLHMKAPISFLWSFAYEGAYFVPMADHVFAYEGANFVPMADHVFAYEGANFFSMPDIQFMPKYIRSNVLKKDTVSV